MTAQAYALTQAQVNAVQHAVSAANTAAATTTGVDLTGYEGPVKLVVDVGAITGSLALRVEDSADNSSWGDPVNAANFTMTTDGAASTYSKDVAATANKTYAITIDPRSVRKFIRFLGTIVTGPSLLSVSIIGNKKHRP